MSYSNSVTTGGGFLSLATAQIRADLFLEFGDLAYSAPSPLAWGVTGRNLAVLAAEAVAFFLINLAWEVARDRRRPRRVEEVEGPVLRVDRVTKVYRNLASRWASSSSITCRFTAVEELSLEVRRAECFGLIGLNGAGGRVVATSVQGRAQPSS